MAALSFKTDFLGTADPGGGSPAVPATYQAVNEAAAVAGYAISRTGPMILVALTEDLDPLPGTFALPGSPVSGDIVRIVRHGGGLGLWSRSVGGDSSDVLRGRDDFIEYQWSGSAWIRVLLREQQVLRVNAATYTVTSGDHLLDLVFHTTSCTVTLPNNLGTRTRFRLVQEGSAVVTIAPMVDGQLTSPDILPPLATTGDGTALAVTVIGNEFGNTARYRFVLESHAVDATRLDASTLSEALSPDISLISLLAFDEENSNAPVRIPAEAVGGAGGVGGGGFTTQIVDTGALINISSSANGVHYRLRVAAPLQLMSNAVVGTRAAVTPASTGTTSVMREGAAVYRLPPTDDPDDAGRFVPFDVNDYTEFECIRNTTGTAPGDGGTEAEWDVWGVPAGTETTLAGTLDLNQQTILPGAPVPLTLTGGRNYVAADSGKTFEVTGTGTPGLHSIPSSPSVLPPGWTVDIYNSTTASSFLIDGPGATNVTLAAGGVATVKVLNNGRVRVAIGATTLTS